MGLHVKEPGILSCLEDDCCMVHMPSMAWLGGHDGARPHHVPAGPPERARDQLPFRMARLTARSRTPLRGQESMAVPVHIMFQPDRLGAREMALEDMNVYVGEPSFSSRTTRLTVRC